jgi:hypothetical protein
MRTAAICPTCATYENALCVLYNGPLLENIGVEPLDSLETALVNIDTTVGEINTTTDDLYSEISNVTSFFTPLNGTVSPTANASFIGQLYVDTVAPALYYAISVGSGSADWVQLANN